MTGKIPFLDLITPHREMEDELVAVFRDAVKTGQFIGGPVVEEFEREFAAFCGTKYAIGVGSGTDALRFALIAAGINKGDIVITVPNTFIATTEAISQAGAGPEFIDIDEKTYNLDPEKLRKEDSDKVAENLSRMLEFDAPTASSPADRHLASSRHSWRQPRTYLASLCFCRRPKPCK
jgi:dTDP-4-amino-4,6-dideoxygalactose transaminase